MLSCCVAASICDGANAPSWYTEEVAVSCLSFCRFRSLSLSQSFFSFICFSICPCHQDFIRVCVIWWVTIMKYFCVLPFSYTVTVLLFSAPQSSIFFCLICSIVGEDAQTAGGLWKARGRGRHCQPSQRTHQRGTYQEDVGQKWNSTRPIPLPGERSQLFKNKKICFWRVFCSNSGAFPCLPCSSTTWCYTACLNSDWWGRSSASERGSTSLAWPCSRMWNRTFPTHLPSLASNVHWSYKPGRDNKLRRKSGKQSKID